MSMDTRALQPGSELQNGKYRIHSVLGQGGFGITYLAEQTGLGMRVAIKEFFLKGSCQRDSNTSKVSVPVSENEELVNRCLKKFKSEARKIASVNDDHIVNIIDIFDENGTSYYVMKYLGGGSLASKLAGGPFPEKTALRIVGEVAEALSSIHASGLLHLDVKPANILMDERGRSVLIDFGVSKYVDSNQDSSTTSSLIGFSRGFAPLEQVNSTSTSLSPASDIYALGATLYNLVTGSAPPEASVVMDAGLPAFPPGLSEETKNAITQAMQPRRKDRPQDVKSFLALLPEEEGTESEDDTVVVNMVSSDQDAVGTSHRGRIPLIISAAMLGAALVLTAVNFLGRRNAGPTASENEVVVKAAEYDELKSKVTTMTQKNTSLQKQVNDLSSQVNTLNTRNSTLQKENTKLKSDVASYKPDAERWRRQLQLNN